CGNSPKSVSRARHTGIQRDAYSIETAYMRLLRTLLEGVQVLELRGSEQVMVENIAIDSRQVKPGGMFLAVRGSVSDGHKFIENAIQNGAKVIVCEELPDGSEQVTYVKVPDTKDVAGIIAHQYYGRPSEQLRLVGITGTNGKTTVATLLYRMMQEYEGRKTGLISTVEYRIGGRVYPSTHTTPDAISLNRLLREMADEGCDMVF